MATLIEAITAYRPRVVHGQRIAADTIAARLARHADVTPAVARRLLGGLHAELLTELVQGHVVQLPGIGTFRTSLGVDGRVRPTLSVDRAFRRALADVSSFKGEIARRENLGLATADLVALWDAAHPDDPVNWRWCA